MIVFVFLCMCSCQQTDVISPLFQSDLLRSISTRKDPFNSLKTQKKSAEELNVYLSTIDREHRFLSVFYIGETQYSDVSLDEVAHFASDLEEEYQFDFYDGVGHGHNWSDYGLDEAISEIKIEIPAAYQERLINGLLMSLILDTQGDLDTTNTKIIGIESRFPSMDLQDGVRVGFQRVHGHRPEAALSMTSSLPENHRVAVIEELGWRVGTEFFSRFVNHPWDSQLTQNERCVYRHGIARGRAQFFIDEGHFDRAIESVQRLDSECAQAAWQGLGTALRIHHGSPSKMLAHSMDTTSTQRKWLRRGFDRHQIFHMWDLGL